MTVSTILCHSGDSKVGETVGEMGYLVVYSLNKMRQRVGGWGGGRNNWGQKSRYCGHNTFSVWHSTFDY